MLGYNIIAITEDAITVTYFHLHLQFLHTAYLLPPTGTICLQMSKNQYLI